MALDLNLLRLLKHRGNYDKVRKGLPMDPLDPKTRVIVKDFDQWFAQNPECPSITMDDFEQFWLMFRLNHPSLTETDNKIYAGFIKDIIQKDPSTSAENLMDRLLQAASVQRVAEVLQAYQTGGEVDWATELAAESKFLTEELAAKSELAFVEPSLEDQLAAAGSEVGLHWRLKLLDEAVRPLVGGDFGILAGRPDQGKTTLVVSEVTHMLPQMAELYGPDRPCIWFNNEGKGERIWVRIYQSALRATQEQLRDWQLDGSLQRRFEEAVGGPRRILIADIHGRSNQDVENYIRKHRPALCVYDMIDNIRFKGKTANNGERTDQMLETMYAEAREWGVRYDFAGLATSQLSADAEGEMYPRLAQLKDSKTGKQGACDFIITLGSTMTDMYRNSRFIGMTKHKNLRTGHRPPRGEVLYMPDVARLEDAPSE